MDSWTFFDKLLDECHIVGTPGAGFGPSGEGYFRLTAFNTREKTMQAMERVKELASCKRRSENVPSRIYITEARRTMVNTIVGANWGDEGKGKVTDLLAEKSDVVVRFPGRCQRGPYHHQRVRQVRPASAALRACSIRTL